MRKIFSLFFGLLVCLSFVHADLILEENFNYPVGDLEQTTDGVEPGKWMVSRKAGDAKGTSPQVADKQLTYPGYVASGKGKVAVLDAAVGANEDSQRISVYYTDTLGARDTTDMYAAMIVNPLSAANTSGRDFLVWEGSVTSSSVRGRVFLKKNGTKLQMGISKNSTSPTSGWSEDLEPNTPVLLVFKYEYHPGGSNDSVKLFINPNPTSSEAANAYLVSETDVTSKTDIIVRGIGLRQRGTGAEIGGLRIATTWEEALGMAADGLNVESTNPAQNAFVEASLKTVQVTFNKPVSAGSGKATLNDEEVQSTIEGATVYFNVVLAEETDYTLAIPAGAFVADGKENPSISLSFTTKNPNVYISEYFRYEAGTALEGQGGWVLSTQTTNQGGTSPLVGDTTLCYATYGGSAQGQVLALDSIAQGISGDSNRTTVLPFTSSKLGVGDTVYTAMMVNMRYNPSTSGKSFFGYIKQGANDGANTTLRGIVSAMIQHDTIWYGIVKKEGEVVWSAPQPKDSTALLVVRYINRSTSSTSDADEFALYVNPDLSKTEAENGNLLQVATDNAANGGADLQAIAFRQMKTMAFVGGIRVAKTWKDALAYTTPDEPESGDPDPDDPNTGEGLNTTVNSLQAKLIIRQGQLLIITPHGTYTPMGQKVE
ncbi:MAG: Ig-like domain-containing protein [Paludibacteraceae bacterium]|nr:Ig-like domain-containing protein [Paludibacteraceae bacterium]